MTLSELQSQRQKHDGERRQFIFRLLQSGHNYREAGKAMGLSRQRVHQLLPRALWRKMAVEQSVHQLLPRALWRKMAEEQNQSKK